MNNDQLKNKIMGIISTILLSKVMKEKYILKCGDIERIADALIAANIGDVREVNFEADNYYRMWQGALVELERAEHRAEVAERKGMTDEKVYSVDEVNHLISEMDKVIAKLKTENVALRERLEKAVELPCKLYDKVWDKNRSEFEILEIRVTGTNFYIYCGNKTTGETVYFDGEDIGDEWFTTEEACDLHRRAFGLDKPKNESDEVRLAELKGEKK